MELVKQSIIEAQQQIDVENEKDVGGIFADQHRRSLGLSDEDSGLKDEMEEQAQPFIISKPVAVETSPGRRVRSERKVRKEGQQEEIKVVEDDRVDNSPMKPFDLSEAPVLDPSPLH